ncbi:MAG: hypothetical protein ACR2Q3_01550 [Woeseiaceae bacterium]
MKILITEKVIKVNVGGKLQTFAEGDQVTVDDDIGHLCVANGWAEDLEGKVKTGERVPGASGEIVPDTIAQKVAG